ILVFPDPFEIRTDFCLRVGLIRETNKRIPDKLMLDGRIARLVLDALDVEVVVGIERIAHSFVDRHVPYGAEEPQTVLHDRTAYVEVEVLYMIDEVAELEAPGAQVVGQVVRLPA